MALRLQELQQREAITNQDGTPSQYFLRYLKARGGALTDLEAELASKVPQTRLINTTDGIQGGGDLSADLTLSLTDTGVSAGTYTAPTITVDVKGRIISATNGTGALSYVVPFGFTTAPSASEVMLLHTFPIAVTFPDEFAGAVGKVGTPPASTFNFTVKKLTAAGTLTTVGTISVSSAGVSTFTTTGTTVSYAVGDQIQVIAQSGTDSISDASFSFLGSI